jgi:hypothetical protein
LYNRGINCILPPYIRYKDNNSKLRDNFLSREYIPVPIPKLYIKSLLSGKKIKTELASKDQP